MEGGRENYLKKAGAGWVKLFWNFLTQGLQMGGYRMKPTLVFLLWIGWAAQGVGEVLATPGPLGHPEVTPTVTRQDWRTVEKILGRQGQTQGDMLKVSFTRTDLNVLVSGTPIEPELALTTWFTFKPLSRQTLVTGEMVLLDQEVPKVMVPLVRYGFQVDSLHDPLINESPSVKVLRIQAKGSRAWLAEVLREALYTSGTPQVPPERKKPSVTPEDWSKVEAILGPGTVENRVLEYDIPLEEPIRENGMDFPAFMGMGSVLRLQKTCDHIASAGSFLLTKEQVKPVVEALTEEHFAITGVQNATLTESPRLFQVTYWVQGKTEETAKGLKAVIEKIDLSGQEPTPSETPEDSNQKGF